MLVYYNPVDDLWHERLLLAKIYGLSWVVATPTFDVYDETLGDYLGVKRVGVRGGLPLGIKDGQAFRFDQTELLTQYDEFMEDGEEMAAELRERYGPPTCRMRDKGALVIADPAPATGAPHYGASPQVVVLYDCLYF